MATKRRTPKTAPKPAIDPIFLSMWERIELHTNVLSERGSWDEAIMTLGLRDRLRPQPDEIDSMGIQEVGEGAWAWDPKKEAGQKRGFRFSQDEMDHICKAYDLRHARPNCIDLRPVAMALMFKFISREAFEKKAKSKKSKKADA